MNFLQEANALSGESVQLCYRCGKCTSGCPVAEEMAYGPARLLELIRLNRRDQVLASPDIWLCAGCETCATRCPNAISAARVIDSLRALARREKAKSAVPAVPKFNRLFLTSVRATGRMHELSLMGLHKLWTLNLFSDLGAGMKMLIKGKVPFLPERIAGRDDVRRIFKKIDPPSPDPPTEGQRKGESVEEEK
jgi:heterodisulfide reductase subunit C